MIQVKKLTTINDIQNLVFEQSRNQKNGRFRSPYFYRGMSNASYELSTSLMRNCSDMANILETRLLDSFIKYVSIEDPTINESIWKAMIIGQHYGLPTRLLDWSHSALVVLHFANSESNLNYLDKRDSVVWRIDAKELMDMLPQKYKDALNGKKTFIFSVDLLLQVTSSIDGYDEDMADRSLVVIEPPSLNQRIVNQYSFFTILPKGITNLEKFLDENTEHTVKYVIDHSLRWDLRDILDQLNMNDRIINPGKEGIAKWLARHYFVRKTMQ